MGIGGVERRRTVDMRLTGKAITVDFSLHRQGFMHLIFRFTGGQQIPGGAHFAKGDFQAITGGADFALIVRVFASNGFIRKRFPFFRFQFFQQFAVPHQIQRFIADDFSFQ